MFHAMLTNFKLYCIYIISSRVFVFFICFYLNSDIIKIHWLLYQSEGFPRTGYFIPAHVGAGAGQIWAFFRRRLWPKMWTQKMWTQKMWTTFFSRWGIRKKISARHYLEIARNCGARIFLKSASSENRSLLVGTT